MINTIYTNLIKNPITSLIGAVICGFGYFTETAEPSIKSASDVADTLITIAQNTKGYTYEDWAQIIAGLFLMFFTKDSFKKS